VTQPSRCMLEKAGCRERYCPRGTNSADLQIGQAGNDFTGSWRTCSRVPVGGSLAGLVRRVGE
jgi:hypothetical protein